MADIVEMRKPVEAESTPRLPPEASVASAIGELIVDAQKLIRQEAALLRADFRSNLDSKTNHWVMLGIGACISGLGVFWISAALIYFIRESEQIPFWMSAGIIGVAALILGAVVVFLVGRTKQHDTVE